jgi:hypothetical protein
MKIDHAIVSSNNNPTYLDFWPFVAKAWRKIGITPVLVYLYLRGEEDKVEELEKWGKVIALPLLASWDVVNQAQTSRLYAATKIEGVNLISDVDMLPISESYFKNTVAEIGEECLASYTADVIDKGFYLKNPQYPMCYLAAHNSTFREIIGDYEWEGFIISFMKERMGYGSDQRVFYKRLMNWSANATRFVKLKRGWEEGRAFNRLDKVKWQWGERELESGELFDCHMPRPYSKNKELLDPLFIKLEII